MNYLDKGKLEALLFSLTKIAKDETESYWPGRNERDFEKDIISILGTINILAVKLPDKTDRYTFPDLLLHWRTENLGSCSCYLEIKKPKGRISENQKISFEMLNNYIDVFVVKSLHDLLIFLSNLHSRYFSKPL